MPIKNQPIQQRTLKEIIAEEYTRCAADPIYFMKKYCKIQHPTKGKIPFHLYAFQEQTLLEVDRHRFNLILKSRQLGISTLSAAYSVWKMIFTEDYNILVIAIKQEVAKNLVTKVRVMYDGLPSWMRVQTVEDNKLSLRLANGSQIKAVAASPEAGRSEALSLLIIDEAAFIDYIDDIWTAATPTLSTGGSCIALSCVTSDTFVFSDMGIQQVEDFIPSENIGDYEIPSYNILGVNNLRKGNLFHTNGKVKTRKIKTKFSELEASDNHKLWACKSGKYDWYRLDELTTDDWIAIQYGMNTWGNNDDVSDFSPKINGNHKNIFNVDKITPDISYLLGLYIAEGSSYLSYNSNGKLVGGNITLTCGDSLIESIKNIGLSFSKTDDLHYTISSKTFIEFLQYLGFELSRRAHQKIIPKRLLQMSSENIAALLSGIFDGDGFARSKTGLVGIGLSSEQLINQIRIILNNFGILSSKYIVSKDLLNSYDYFDNKFNYDSYRLELNYENSLKFHNLIGFRFNRKSVTSLLAETVDLTNSKSNNVIPHSLDMCHYMFDIYGKGNWTWKKYHKLNISEIVNKTKRYKTEHISSHTVTGIYNIVRDLLPTSIVSEYDKILMDNVHWVKIKEITDSENYTYDFSLPSNPSDFWDHSVIYNGIIGHQTPNGVGNWFHKQWVGAEDGTNQFNPIKLHWSVHPERNQQWRDEQDRILGPKLASQECVGYDEIVTIKDADGSIFDIKIGELAELMDKNTR
jgi:intein/homing endonuclease